MERDWESLKRQLRAGHIDRRDFLAAAVALGISGALARDVFAAEAPKRGGHLAVGLNQGSTSDSLDSATWTADFMNCAGPQLYDTLTNVNERMQVQPSLAESWTSKAGLKEWVFKLRNGVTFHNGKTLTPADVIYSLNHHRGKDSKSLGKATIAAVDDIEETGRNEVTIVLSGGNADMPYLLADWHLQIAPEGSKFDGVGTGAYRLESFEPGVRLLTKRNPNDWRKDRGYVDTVETVAINDPAARLNALLSGTVQIINRVPLSSVSSVEKSLQLQLFRVAAGGHPTMAMAFDKAPYDNLDLRLALKHVIDREAVLKTVLRGYGTLGNDHPIASIDPAFAKDIPQRKQDIDKAKFHYKKSGYTGPIVFTTSEATSSGAVEIAQVFQANAAKAGIDVQVNRVSSDGYWVNVWQKQPFCAGVYAPRPTADMILTAAYSSGSPINESHWKNPRFDSLLASARAEIDPAKRKQMYHDLEMLVRDDGATIIPVFFDTLDAGAKKIRGFVPSPFQQMSGARAMEKVRFA